MRDGAELREAARWHCNRQSKPVDRGGLYRFSRRSSCRRSSFSHVNRNARGPGLRHLAGQREREVRRAQQGRGIHRPSGVRPAPGLPRLRRARPRLRRVAHRRHAGARRREEAQPRLGAVVGVSRPRRPAGARPKAHLRALHDGCRDDPRRAGPFPRRDPCSRADRPVGAGYRRARPLALGAGLRPLGDRGSARDAVRGGRAGERQRTPTSAGEASP